MKFSVITVCLNAVDTIEQTIKSVLQQDYDDIEYIIVDGASTDGTLDIIKKYSRQISYWISEKDSGIYDAMNKGISKSTGDVISFVNADDWYEEKIISRINRYFIDSKADIVGGAVNYVVNDKISTVNYSRYDLNSLSFYGMFQHQALFAKREVFQKIGTFNVKYKIEADYEWMLRVWKNRIKAFVVKDVCANFRNTGITANHTYDVTLELMQAAKEVLGDECVEIEQFYKARLEKTFYEQIFECEVKKGDVNFIKQFLDSDEYYIWGAGRVGVRCLELLEKLDIKIKGFIDSYKDKQGQKIGKYMIYAPESADREITICVALREFENQVEKSLIDRGYDSGEYLLFSELVKKAVEYKTGKKYYAKSNKSKDCDTYLSCAIDIE